MEIIHNNYQEKENNSPFSLSYGEKSAVSSLENIEKNLLEQMGSIFSIIHGGTYKKRRNNHISA